MTGARTPARPAAHAAGLPALLPVASYARRSKRAKGDGKGATINIEDQHAQNRAYIAATFGPDVPVREYDDNMSAWNPDVWREHWEEMLDDTRAGQLRAVVGRYADRLTRQPEQGEKLLTACRTTGAELHTTSVGHITSALQFRIELAIAAEESDQKSRRMTDHHRRLANAGAFSGGRRAFGYTDGMAGVNDAEAAALVDAFNAVLDGETISGICRQWNAAGITTAAGNEWTPTVLGRLMRQRRLTGVRRDGTPATWPEIIDPTTFAAVGRILDRRAGEFVRYTGARAHELSGVLVCAECGRPMMGKPTRLKSGPAYVCLSRKGHGQAPTANVWRIVRRAVCRALTQVDAAGVFVPEPDREAAARRQAERAELDAVRAETVRDIRMRPADKADALDAIDERLAELDSDDAAEAEAAARPARVLSGLTGMALGDTLAAFDALPLDRQRAVIAELGTPVLRRLPSRKGVFNPRRVLFVFADGRLETVVTRT